MACPLASPPRATSPCPALPALPQMALVLLCRLLSWLHLGSVVAPGSADCLHFVLVLGEAQAGKASLFQQLVAAPPEYAGQLGGSGTSGAPGGLGSGGVTSRSGELKVGGHSAALSLP